MIHPKDKERLAQRIERLELRRTHDWLPGDGLEFQNQLPSSRVLDPHHKLPTPERVRSEGFTVEEYQWAVQRCLRMESLISRNRANSPRRMMHDMIHGRPPGFRR